MSFISSREERLYYGLYDFCKWIAEHSHDGGYQSQIYLYGDDVAEVKLFLARLMYFDSFSDYGGWSDRYTEYCSAKCFVSRAKEFCELVGYFADGPECSLAELSSSDTWLQNVCDRPGITYVQLALFDMQELLDDPHGLHVVMDVIRQLSQKGATVILTGPAYPTEVFKDYPDMARLLLDGQVVKISDGNAVFEGVRPIRRSVLPLWDGLAIGGDIEGDLVEWSEDERDELNFYWELLCLWKKRYKLFDFDLFKYAFQRAWKCLLSDVHAKTLRHDRLLIALLNGFVGGPDYSINLITDFGPTGCDIVYGNSWELRAAECLIQSLAGDVRRGAFLKDKGSLKLCYRLTPVLSDDWKPSDYWDVAWWERTVSVDDCVEAADDLAATFMALCKPKELDKQEKG